MIPFAWDTETARFGPGLQAPPLSCMSYCYEGGRGLVGYKDAEELFEELIYDDEYLLIGHNIAYDLAVIAAEYPRFLRPIFEAYKKNRIADTMIRQKLLDNTIGRFRGYNVPKSKKELQKNPDKPFRWVQFNYTLDDLYYRVHRKRLDKDTWRLKYGELREIPLEKWPEGARGYATDDAIATWDVYQWQVATEKKICEKLKSIKTHISDAKPLEDEHRQTRAAWWLHLMKTHGIRTDPRRVHMLSFEVDDHYEDLESHLKEIGLVKSNGVRDTIKAKKLMAKVMGGEDRCRKTDKGSIKLDMEACTASADERLMDYAALSSLKAVKSKDLPALAKGNLMPIHSNFNSFVATGRTSSSSPNIQNIRRLPGIRECFVPREGHVFLDADYDGLELRTLAQVCLKIVGHSKLAEVLNRGDCPHLMVAADILNISYKEAERRRDAGDEEVDDARQLGKCVNFGLPGGLGIETFIYFARKAYGVILTEHRARQLKAQWMRSYPEMEKYFFYINQLCKEGGHSGTAFVKHLFTNRIRGGVPYTVACNSLFQGLGGDATKEAGFLIAEACYLDKSSPLYGCRPVNYIHDQFIVECPEERCHEAAMELARIMVEGANKYLPDVPATVKEPIVTRCWSKKAKQVWVDGKLAPWDEEYQVKVRGGNRKKSA